MCYKKKKISRTISLHSRTNPPLPTEDFRLRDTEKLHVTQWKDARIAQSLNLYILSSFYFGGGGGIESGRNYVWAGYGMKTSLQSNFILHSIHFTSLVCRDISRSIANIDDKWEFLRYYIAGNLKSSIESFEKKNLS